MSGRVVADCVLFDLDGTLTDPRAGITKGVQFALGEVGIVVEDRDSLVPYIGPPIHEGFARLHGLRGGDLTRAVEVYRSHYREFGLFDAEVIAGVPDLLVRLSRNRVLALATSKLEVMAEEVVEHFGFARHLSFVAGASLDATRRAKADVIEHALQGLGAEDRRDRAVMVGDRQHDVLGGKAAGITTVGVQWGFAEPGELETAGADHVVATVAELGALLG